MAAKKLGWTELPVEIRYFSGGEDADGILSPSKITSEDAFRFSRSNQTETEAFKNWFGDSKVVDADGKPLVVYHGSPDARFAKEDGIFKNMTEKYGGTGGSHAFWFASSRQVANTYADDRRAFDYQSAESGIISAYLSLKNPLIVDGGGRMWRDAQAIGKTTNVIEKAHKDGHDGAIIKNVKDDYNGNATLSRVTDTYVVFSPNQIKSATGNNGKFDANNNDIRFSRSQSFDAPTESKLDSIVYALQDKHVDLKRVTEAIKKTGAELADRVNAYLQEELYHGRTAKRTQDFIKHSLDPLINAMRISNVTMADFEEYLWMRHAEERNIQIAKVNPEMQDGGSGIKTQEARDYLAKLSPADKLKYDTLAKRVDEINAKSRQVLLDYGLESEATIKA
ncbi:MAG TPA: hypothetical protein PLC01_11035, partial [Methylotenera sp.]|nr:hypothetical protein [Methylotenera sp.]